jgi:hypothetical protein
MMGGPGAAGAAQPGEEIVTDVVSLAGELAAIAEHWRPRVVGRLNGQEVKLAKFRGAFVWPTRIGRRTLSRRRGALPVNSGSDGEVGPGFMIDHTASSIAVADEASVLLFEPGCATPAMSTHLTAPGGRRKLQSFGFLADTYERAAPEPSVVPFPR